jgi:hypothetical protein
MMALTTAAWNFILAHQLGAYMVISAGIGQLPMPTQLSSSFYRWFFGTVQVVAMNFARGKVGLNGGTPFNPQTGEKIK